ncbi:peptidase domain-containing ABC transporter [Christiangramia sabulilitoris]|uniref:ATP-binding cassette domain-containing protein n=1 Tax=Christiangramia sabulilitoris TaxID=2583991 RepID=A0A550I972_9FLAO|nr:ATP-binding cassette domain-containing protein [Christiangramia sabulilitoris]TRO67514.1 ATP-binding cassette domain-containing protein [Christiangramia sabulilitoris]
MSNPKLSVWQRFIGLIKLEKKDFLQILYYAIFAGLVNLSVPLGIQAIVNLIQGARITTSWIVLVTVVTLGVAFVGVLQLMQIRILENVQQKIFTRASFEFAYRFPKIKMSQLKDFYPPELANRFFDVLTIQKGISKLVLDFPAAVLQIIFGLILLSLYHPFFILYGLLLVLLIFLVFKFTARTGLNTSMDESKMKYRIAHWIQEVARTLVSFKTSGRTNHAITKNDKLVTKYLDARESHFQILRLQFIQMIVFKVLVTAGLLIIGGLLVLNQQMNIGQFVAAEIIILLIISSVEKMIIGLENLYDLLTSLEKLGEVVDKELETQGGDKTFADSTEFNVELKNVSFTGFSKKVVLKDINLTIHPGDKILLEGPNGSGKSTLLKIIAGLIEPTSGKVYVNGISLQNIDLNFYHSLLGQSLTEESPFEGTLIENITFGDKSIGQKEIYAALEKTGLTEFVRQQPDGLETMIFPEGMQLPYTIAKKIVLARSLVRKPGLLILNEPLDQIDRKEQSRIVDNLFAEDNPWSIIVTSQDEIWREKCNRHIVIVNGEIQNKSR